MSGYLATSVGWGLDEFVGRRINRETEEDARHMLPIKIEEGCDRVSNFIPHHARNFAYVARGLL